MDITNFILTSELFSPQWRERHQKWKDMADSMAGLKPEKLLSVGVGPKTSSAKWNKLLHEVFNTLTLFVNLEIDPQKAMQARLHNNPYISHVDVGDVRNVDQIYNDGAFDIVFWSHGPEHITREEWEETFAKLEKLANMAIIIQCPWGSGYNGHPGHFAKSIRKGEFEAFGFTVFYAGKEDTRDADIFGYKVLNEN
jgi:hypothetical protein